MPTEVIWKRWLLQRVERRRVEAPFDGGTAAPEPA